MDADDVMEPEQAARLKNLKETLDPSVDVVMMKYLTGFDEKTGRTSFSLLQERILKTTKSFRWQGRVHKLSPLPAISYTPILRFSTGRRAPGIRTATFGYTKPC